MEKSFFKEFEPLSVADQLAKIHHDLGGEKDYETLIWNAPEGIEAVSYTHLTLATTPYV